MVDAAALNGNNHVRVPRAGVLQIRAGEIGVAVRVGMEDRNHAQTQLAGALFSRDLLGGVELESVLLPALVRVAARDRGDRLAVPVLFGSQQDPAALVWIGGFEVPL